MSTSTDESTSITESMHRVGRAARGAGRELARSSTGARDRALEAMAARIEERAEAIAAANAEDLAADRKSVV